ncbi:MAG: YbhB/YbcL family Raf kinase inhibitor-like protein [Candidatus Aminicenantales bacterium]
MRAGTRTFILILCLAASPAYPESLCWPGKERIRALPVKGEGIMDIKIISSAFKEGEMIPRKYTCDGEDISPPLAWSGVPENAQSIALISDDPDAPMGTWVHWVLFNLPATENSLPEGIPPDKELSHGAKQGRNDFRRIGYGGPCPPSGTHRYFFKLYALDTILSLAAGATKAELLKAMEGHIVAQGQLMGKYKRQR